jgi:TIR domain-containing protein
MRDTDRKGKVAFRTTRVFISHSSADKDFVQLVATELCKVAFETWFDKEQILVGDDVLDKLGEGLQTMDFLVFVISRKALQSRWVDRELKFAARKEIENKQILILPFIIDDTPSTRLPWFIQHLRPERVSPDITGARFIVKSITARVARRSKEKQSADVERPIVNRDPVVDRIISRVGLGEWKKATAAALEIIKETDATGWNDRFQSLFEYRNLPDDDEMLWSALHTIEMCVDMAPDLITRPMLFELAAHPNFSVRSSAASICMDWAQFVPDRVPLDLLVGLSAHSEDWYVQAPANAALKSMVRAVPGVLQIFYSRISSSDMDESVHSAACVFDIAMKEPGLLDFDDLKQMAVELKSTGNPEALTYIRRSMSKVKKRRQGSRYKYGL